MKAAIHKTLVVLLGVLILLVSAGGHQASAQEGADPIALPYRLGQGSIGDSGAATPSGAYVTAVPLDLPVPRGDLSLPFSVVYNGGNRVGAAGVGWSIPLSYVRRSMSLSRRKPAHLGPGSDDQTLPKSAPRLFLNLGSGPMLMAETNTDGVYRPFVSTTYIDLTETSEGWVASDPAGRQYTFSQIVEPNPNLSIPQLSTELGDENLWLLTRITDRTGKNWVSLHYDVFDMIPPPPHEIEGDFTIKELVLREIDYSFDLSGTCPKHRIEMQYRSVGSTAPHPAFLDLIASEGRLRARTRILDQIKIWSQAQPECTESGRELLRSYGFRYSDDVDTGQPRLTSVDVFGRGDNGSDEETGLPVARYEYGTATSDETLVYGNSTTILLPEGAPETDIGFALHSSTTHVPTVSDSFSLQYLKDLTGDGRADYLYPNGPFFIEDLPDVLNRYLLMATNVPSDDGSGTSTFPSVTPFTVTNVVDDDLPINFGVTSLRLPPGGGNNWATNTWQQLIDWNGDGRTDVVQALRGQNPNGEPSLDHWRVLINTPATTDTPGDTPGEIEWIETHVDISYLRIQARRNDDEGLPLMRSQTTSVINMTTGTREESGRVTEWKLADVNGDAFPDFVFNQVDVISAEREICDDSGECHAVQVIDIPQNNEIMVIYHTGPLMAGAGSAAVSRWAGPAVVLRKDGGIGVERFRWGPNHTQHMTAGFLEVNGDGIVDHVVEERRTINSMEQLQRLAIRSSGLPQQIDQELPENQTAWRFQERGRAILLPGPVNVIQTDQIDKCPNDPQTGTLLVGGQTPYTTRMLSTLRDLTGDGIADYVYFGTRTALSNGVTLEYPGVELNDNTADLPNWWVMIGTGAAFVPPRPIEAPLDAPFEVHMTREQCDGIMSRTFSDLIDMDGDGRLDIVHTDDLHRIVVAKLEGGTGGMSAHDAGYLIREDNGYGAATLITYGSAKADFRTKHQLPFEEIVVTEIETILEKGLGMSVEPVRYAYGDAHLHYEPLLGRWIFSGYGRRVVLQGLPDSGVDARIRGTAMIFEAVQAGDLPGGYQRYALTGNVSDVNYLVGAFTIDPRQLLDVVLTTTSRWRGNRHIRYATKLPTDQGSPGPVLVPLNEECYDLDPLGGIGNLELCKRTGIAYQAEITDWRGTNPYPATDSVATRTSILREDVDEFGRATVIEFENDRSRTDDDVCAVISYASGDSGSPRVLDAVYVMRFQNCQNSTPYSGIRYLYDNLPEGQVGTGLLTGQITERYDTLLGQKLEEYQLDVREYDDYGNVIGISLVREDGVTSTFETTFDAFGLVPEQSEGTASDVSIILTNSTEYDPISLLPVSDVDSNGRQLRAYYDRFGRIEMATAQLPGDPEEYVQTITEYLGDRSTDPEGRRVREWIFREWTPISIARDGAGSSSLAVTEVTGLYDELGRFRYQETDLGADYSGGNLVAGYTEYDGLSRPLFVASPFLSSDPPGETYGTTYQYYPDGQIKCAIQGEGLQLGPATTDESADRYPTCFTYSFENHKAVVRARGPNELLSGTPQHGAYNEAVSTAIGRTLWHSRWLSGKRLEHAKFSYDRLGQLARISRYAAPDTLNGLVVWKFRSDSLGQTLSVEEPAAAVRSYKYDHWGNPTEIAWTDSTVSPAVDRSIFHTFDGFGRLVSIEETEDSASNPDRRVEYFYDQVSGEADHLNANNLIGRLSHTKDSVMSAYFGYDGLGRRTSDTRVHLKDGERYSTVSQLSPFGALEELSFMLPDVAHDPETVNYTFDSAGLVQSISRAGPTGNEDIWTTNAIDAFGRYQEIELGNGVTLQFDYRPDRRRELMETRIVSTNTVQSVNYQGYDGQMLLKGQVENFEIDGSNTLTTIYTYDALNRLARSKSFSSSSGTVERDEEFRYDGLGNVVEVVDHTGPNDLIFIPHFVDRDRICSTIVPQPDFTFPSRVDEMFLFWGVSRPDSPQTKSDPANYLPDKALSDTVFSALCNYRYDAAGNVTRIIDGPQNERLFEYDAWARIVSMENGGALAAIQYDAFGAVAENSLTGTEVGKNRINQHYGSLIEKTTFLDDAGMPTTIDDGGSSLQSFTERLIPGPSGIVAMVRRTDTGEIITLYPHGDFTANQLVTGENGETVQNVSYRSFGERIIDTGSDNPSTFMKYLWNGGETYEAFGITHVGSRVYESHTGRFLQRDPLLVTRGASRMNPYAFAFNDPINFNDPSGLDAGSVPCDSLNPACSRGGAFGDSWDYDFDFSGGTADPYLASPFYLAAALVAAQQPYQPIPFEEPSYRVPAEDIPLSLFLPAGTPLTRFEQSASEHGGSPGSNVIVDPVTETAIGYYRGGWLTRVWDREGNILYESEIGINSEGIGPIEYLIPGGAAKAGIAKGLKTLITRGGLRYRPRTGVGGRLESVFAQIEPKHLGTGTSTTVPARRWVQKLGRPTDEAGHAIAKQLGGRGGRFSRNIFPQNLRINRGQFRAFEKEIAREIQGGSTVFVRVVPKYLGNSTRPFEIIYQARINGRTVTRTFANP